ncbi:MAG: sugar phosphate isomerase/epimerase [Lachnospiraceae bacterium]|nr:sugar phosphate isomerase/epimerase [Lachnospiraceae bacterium]
MLTIGVQTKGIVTEQGDITKGFQKIANAGFTKVDFNLDAFLINSNVYAGKLNKFFDKEIPELVTIFGKYKHAMDMYGLLPSQMHAPYPVYVPGNGKATAYMQGNVIPKSIIIAEAMGVPWVVIHPFKLQYSKGKEAEKQTNLEYFKMLVPLLKQCGVRVCLENLYESVGGRIVEGVCSDVEDAIWYIDTLNEYAGEELFGFCLDTGHLQLAKKDPYDFIKKMGSRIKVLHLHENNGTDDTHQLPYTFGKGEDRGADWEGILKALKEIGYKGTLSFETFPAMNSFPHKLSEAVLKVIYDTGVSMAKQIDNI